MKITRVLNNNTVLIEKNKKLMLLMGLSIGFKKQAGDELDESKVEQKFILSDPNTLNVVEQLLLSIPEEYLLFATNAVAFIKEQLKKEINDSLIVILTDHILYAVERYQKGLMLKNALLFETEQYYKEEYIVALKIVEQLNELFHIKLDEHEAGFIALHIVESELDHDNEELDIKMITRLIHEVLDIVINETKIELDVQSLAYNRFIIHLKFFCRRVLTNAYIEDSKDYELLGLIEKKYIKENQCAMKISRYFKNNYGYTPSDFDVLYLTIHIARVINTSK